MAFALHDDILDTTVGVKQRQDKLEVKALVRLCTLMLL
jgi:hypothetical protein